MPIASEPATALGARLRELRIANNLSQWDLAAKVDTKQNRISNWESGQHEPSLGLLQRIAGVYGMTVAELLDGVM